MDEKSTRPAFKLIEAIDVRKFRETLRRLESYLHSRTSPNTDLKDPRRQDYPRGPPYHI